MSEGLLRRCQMLVTITTGEPWSIRSIVKASQALWVSTADTLQFCGFRTRTLLIGCCRKIDDRKREEIRRKVNHSLSRFVGK